VEAVLFFSTGLVSGVYHLCDTEVYCLMSFQFLQQMDFAFSFNMILLLSVHLSGARKQAKGGLQALLLLVTIFMATNKVTSMVNWVLIGSLAILQFSTTLVYYVSSVALRSFLRREKKKKDKKRQKNDTDEFFVVFLIIIS
jgi:hypothetical protein